MNSLCTACCAHSQHSQHSQSMYAGHLAQHPRGWHQTNCALGPQPGQCPQPRQAQQGVPLASCKPPVDGARACMLACAGSEAPGVRACCSGEAA